MPWVDVHMHLIGGRGQQQDFAGAVDAAIHEMERFGIAMAIVLAPPQVDQQPVYDASAFVGALQRHRGRFDRALSVPCLESGDRICGAAGPRRVGLLELPPFLRQ
ncbi:MAG: hypothetical protein AAB298_02775, partial [Pseudomonadota bacterium]